MCGKSPVGSEYVATSVWLLQQFEVDHEAAMALAEQRFRELYESGDIYAAPTPGKLLAQQIGYPTAVFPMGGRM